VAFRACWTLLGEISGEYPQIKETAPIPSQIERYGDEQQQGVTPNFQFMDNANTRSWFINSSDTKVIQVQRDRFIINWRKLDTGEKYPRYSHEMRPRFEREWGDFQGKRSVLDV
jgi:uncharacterized protein (TIGR04255 family)